MGSTSHPSFQFTGFQVYWTRPRSAHPTGPTLSLIVDDTPRGAMHALAEVDTARFVSTSGCLREVRHIINSQTSLCTGCVPKYTAYNGLKCGDSADAYAQCHAYHTVSGVAVLAFECSRAMLNYRRWAFRHEVVEVEWKSRVAALRRNWCSNKNGNPFFLTKTLVF